MTETEFLQRAEAMLAAIETALDAAPIDADCERAGTVLTVDLGAGGKVVVNAQAPMRQLWVAARSGAHHYAFDGERWIDTRDGSELLGALSRTVSTLTGTGVVLRGPGRAAG